MSNQDETYQRISVPDAAKLLGISAATVRRRIRDGSLQAERVHRPQGITYVVLVSSNHSNQDDRSKSNHEEEITARLKQSGAPAEAMVSLIQTTIATVLGPLVGQVDALRQTVERQADRIAELERENGRLSERLVHIAPADSLGVAREMASRTETTTEPSVPLWRSWPAVELWALLAALIAAGVAAVLLAWRW
jgi:excisionase family DNA binding protein